MRQGIPDLGAPGGEQRCPEPVEGDLPLKRKVLTIAGSDPSGGAGVQVDLAVFRSLEVRGFSAITAVTAQNEERFFSLNPVATTLIREQIRAVADEYSLDAIKIGLLGTEQATLSMIRYLESRPSPIIVLDPIIWAGAGNLLTDPRAVGFMREMMIPLVTVVTPNILEAQELARMTIGSVDDMREAALQIYQMSRGVKGVYLKGGHLEKGDPTDVLFDGISWKLYASRVRYPKKVHGTGCVFSAALTAYLARGFELPIAAARAKEFVTDWIAAHQTGVSPH